MLYVEDLRYLFILLRFLRILLSTQLEAFT